jgi:Pyridoxamine 5'-phosphate oxidase
MTSGHNWVFPGRSAAGILGPVRLSPDPFPSRYGLGEAPTDADLAGRRLAPIGSGEALGLLATVHVGRVGYSHRSLPAIQVVSHVIDGGDIVFRCHGRPPVISPARPGSVVLAYEADDIDPETFTGWRVTATGSAGLVRDPREAVRLDRLLPPWPVGNDTGQLIRLHPGMMSGYRFLGPRGRPPR